MAWTTGTCVGHLALLDALKTYLTVNGWTCLADVTPDTREVYFKGTGLAGTDEIFIGVKEYVDTTNDVHNVCVGGFTGYREGIGFTAQPGAGYLWLTLTDQTMRYWFIVNGRRVIIIAYVNSNYVTAYAGFFLPFCNPSAYPYPMFIGANAASAGVRYSIQNEQNTNFFLPISTNYRTAKYMYGGVWRDIYYSGIQTAIGSYTGYWLHQIIKNGMLTTLNPDGATRYMTPIDIACNLGMIGRLDGVMYTTGYGAVAEDTLTAADGQTWMLVPDVYRTALAQYAAFTLA